MRINKRLKAIADLVDDSSTCIDIGCDHAFLDIYLVKQNRGIKAVASDVLEGPLDQAKKNIKNENLEGKIEVRLGNGLDTYMGEDTVVISGMGGLNMLGIFKNHRPYMDAIETIIISPNNHQEDIKEYLFKNNFHIDTIKLIQDGTFIYQIIKFKKGKVKYSYKDILIGNIEKNEDFYKYYKRELELLEVKRDHFKQLTFRDRLKINKKIKIIKEELVK